MRATTRVVPALPLPLLSVVVVALLSTTARAQCPNITSVSPAVGSLGTRVTLLGCGLDTINDVALAPITEAGLEFSAANGGVRSIVSQAEDTLVVETTAFVPGRCGAAVLYNSSGHPVFSRPDAFCYTTSMAIFVVFPTSGQRGTTVSLFGQFAPGTGGGGTITQVLLAGNAATIVSQSSSEIVVTAGVPAGSTDTGPVRVVANTSAFATYTTNWTYIAPGTISSVTPSSGQKGTRITVAGSNFVGGGRGNSIATVRVAGVRALSVVSFTATEVVFRMGAGPNITGATIVLETNLGAQTILANAIDKLPDGEITSISPGAARSGVSVLIRGTNLDGHTSSLDKVAEAPGGELLPLPR
jgi:hypothetical protein